jgi:hypothetical protein
MAYKSAGGANTKKKKGQGGKKREIFFYLEIDFKTKLKKKI